MKRGVCFFINMDRQIDFLYVALYTLRKHYDGPVGVTHANVSPQYIEEFEKAGVEVLSYPGQIGSHRHGGKKHSWMAKAYSHSHHPFDVNLCYDLDSHFVSSPTEAMFGIIEDKHLVARSTFRPPSSPGRKLGLVRSIVKEPVKFIYAMDGGCVGSVKGSEEVSLWHYYMEKIAKSSCSIARNPEEWGLSVMNSIGRLHPVGEDWSSMSAIRTDTVQRHLSRGRAWSSEEWLEDAHRAHEMNFMGAADLGVLGRALKLRNKSMNLTITLDTSVMDADHYRVVEFKKDNDILKFLRAIEGDKEFSTVDGVVYFSGKSLKSEKKPLPLQRKTFRSLAVPEVLCNFDRASVNLTDMYRGCTGFLVLSGPSTRELDLSLLEKPGLLRMCVNNSSKVIRPHLWTCVDPPDRFLFSVWTDPTIMKFVPDSFRTKTLWDTYKDKPKADYVVGDCPNVFYYPRNTNFVPGEWLTEPTINWGQSKGYSFYDPELKKNIEGTRSCMLVAIRIMAMLGIRTIFLVGADFNMDPKQPYAFDQGKSQGGASSNNTAYQKLNSFFNVLKPHFQTIGMQIYNTNPDSGLKSFEHMPYEDAIQLALGEVGEPQNELTAGMYEKLKEKRSRHKKRARRQVNAAENPPDPKPDPQPEPEPEPAVAGPVLQGVWDPDNSQLYPAGSEPASSAQAEAASEVLPVEELERLQKLRYTHLDLLETREHWLTIFPELRKTSEEFLKKTDALVRKGGCGSCRKKRAAGKDESIRTAELRRLARLFSAALFDAINKDPEAIKSAPAYRPMTLIEASKKFVTLRSITEGTKFDG